MIPCLFNAFFAIVAARRALMEYMAWHLKRPMYGAANYVVIVEVNKLPLKVANIYRRLTT